MNKIYERLLLAGIAVILLSPACNSTTETSKELNEIEVGETFEISVAENQSTGYEMCWVNRKDAKSISLLNKEYKNSGKADCAGCGGTATFTFKGIAPGSDTIKLVNCPGLRDNKTCDECLTGEGKMEKFIAVVR